ncbi:conserved hypothetical protein [Sphingobacterium sp. PM2-P1-29]|nr:conserved hypothetical protein [Sphingobacterium sp. PM2-P1-29]
MKCYLIIIAILFAKISMGQSYVTIIFDSKHLATVNENGAVRLASESLHNQMLKKVNKNIDDINLNLSSLVLVQNVVHKSLTEVNEVLRTGKSVRQISTLIGEIIKQSNSMIDIAKDEPWLLLIAEGTANQLKQRGINLVSEVSEFVLKEGENVLMDYEKRDFLLRKIMLELKVMRALIYSMEKSMYWAKINGILKTVNPFKDFINRDVRLGDEIIMNFKSLKK